MFSFHNVYLPRLQSAPVGGKGDLLASIRAGKKLKKIDVEAVKEEKKVSPLGQNEKKKKKTASRRR
tara:strand:- start:545 stop:742 length:198 start_codon:yes stop_codon:yes gene_type:complete